MSQYTRGAGACQCHQMKHGEGPGGGIKWDKKCDVLFEWPFIRFGRPPVSGIVTNRFRHFLSCQLPWERIFKCKIFAFQSLMFYYMNDLGFGKGQTIERKPGTKQCHRVWTNLSCFSQYLLIIWVKVLTGVNFINILHETFLPIFWRQKIAKLNKTGEKLINLLLYKKRAGKMLMKLTPGIW